MGASVGAETGAYIYAEAGFGKGSNHLDRQTHDNTHLNATNIQINSQKNTTLAGAQATADRIDANVGGNLNIISQQDHVEQNNKQMSAGGRAQISAGTAWEASGNVSSSNAKGSSDQVTQQTGLFAGQGGYHVNADHVELEGGAITSTAAKANNDLTANSLHFSHLDNQSNYKATSVSLSASMQGELGDNNSAQTNDSKNITQNSSKAQEGEKFSYTPSLPQYSSDHDSSTTYATLSDGNITIGGKVTSAQELGIHQDIGTANLVLKLS